MSFIRFSRMAWLLVLAAGLSCLPASSRDYVYTANGSANSISVIDTTTNTVVATKTNLVGTPPSSVSSGPCGIAFTPDGSLAYVTNKNDNNLINFDVVSVIQAGPNANGAVASISGLMYGANAVAITPNGSRVYVALQNVGLITGYDIASNSLAAEISLTLGQQASALAISPDGTRLYASNVGDGSVAVIDTTKNQIVTNVQVGSQPAGLAITPDGTHVYVAVPGSNSVAVIATASNTVVGNISVAAQPGRVTIAGARAYVAHPNSNTVSVIDTTANTVVGTVVVGSNPGDIAVSQDGTHTYVANTGGQSVSIIDNSNNTVVATVPVGANPCGIASSSFPPTLGGGGPGSGNLYYSGSLGSVGVVDVNTLQTNAAAIPQAALADAPTPIFEREIAYDPVTGLMWYTGINGIVHSVNVRTLNAGPSLGDNFPGGTDTANRHLFVDYTNRTLLVDLDDGSVNMYKLSDRTLAGTIPSSFFTDVNVGYYRHFASDMRAGTMWFADNNGSFIEMDPNTLKRTGRIIPFGIEQKGANPGYRRHFVIDPTSNLLLYVVTDGSIASISLDTMKATSFTIPTRYFAGGEVGSGMTITSSFSANYTRGGTITSQGVVNAASFLPGPLAPGEIISIFGTNIGPTTGATAGFNASGLIGTSLANTQVLFDGVAAPLIYVSATQINAIVPYMLAGKTSTQLQVAYQGSKSNAVTLTVAGSAPGIFAVAGGKGQGAILNQDGSVNSSSNPAVKGSIVVIYATGEGQTNPPGVDGKPSPSAPPFPQPVLPVSVSIGGVPADVVFYGSAPGFVGLFQVNARVPNSAASGNAVPVALTVGSATSQPGVTMAVQ